MAAKLRDSDGTGRRLKHPAHVVQGAAAFRTDPRRDDKDLVVNVSVTVPSQTSPGVVTSLAEAMGKAIQVLDAAKVEASADVIASTAVQFMQPDTSLVKERIHRLQTIQKVFAGADWLTAEQINQLQPKPPANTSMPAADWKRRRRIFSVNYGGKDYFAGYQFDDGGQPLPVIAELLKAFGGVADAWTIASWFHFPNAWLVEHDESGSHNAAPKASLDRAADVLAAARKRLGTYVA
jgi:hypothetical protein